MAGNFYSTLAQVFPLLLLAFVWDSGFLARLRRQRRPLRKDDPAGVRFWTKPRVRVYTLLVTGVAVIATSITGFVLAGVIPDSYALRLALCCGLVLVLLTLLTRITIDVLWATQSGSGATAEAAPGNATADTAAEGSAAADSAATATVPVPRPAEPGRSGAVAADDGQGEAS